MSADTYPSTADISECEPSDWIDQRPSKNVLFSAMKNEARFLLEWVAYHKAIGFDEIVICSNPSNDGTEELLAALAEAGEIRHLRATVEKDQSPQIVAALTFESQIGYRDGDWYIWLDADEFLNVHVGDRTVHALISAADTKQCLLINWRIFGSSGHSKFPGRFISPNFTGASASDFPGNLEQKALFRYSKAVVGFGKQGLNRPQLSGAPTLKPSDVAVGSGGNAKVDSHRNQKWFKGKDFGRTHKVEFEEFGWELAQINHYMVRTPDFFKLKRSRGRGYLPNSAGDQNTRHTEKFFLLNDRNELPDTSILFWEKRVTDVMASMLDNPKVATSHLESEARISQLFNENRADQPAEPDKSDQLPMTIPADEHSSSRHTDAFVLTFPAVEKEFIRVQYAAAGNIIEYGSGGSTVLAADLGKRVISVESDKGWAHRLAAALDKISDQAQVHHVDIGPTGAWGVPERLRFHQTFHRYALSVWDRPDIGEPDLVLIDGRFRAACLAAVRLRAKRPTTVLFDDYVERKYYHGVENLARKEEVVGRMARFTVTPGPIPPEMLTQVIGWFHDPR